MDTATIKEYIQLAAEMGWEYQLIDWQWYGQLQPWQNADISTVNPNVDMDEVRRFAKEKGVRISGFGCIWTDVERDDAYLEAFQTLRILGYRRYQNRFHGSSRINGW